MTQGGTTPLLKGPMRRLLAGCLGLAAAAATWTVLAPATPLAPPAPRCLFVFSETNDPRVKVVQRPCHGTVLCDFFD